MDKIWKEAEGFLGGLLFAVITIALLGLMIGAIWFVVAPHPINETSEGVVVDEMIRTGTRGGSIPTKIVDIGQDDYVTATVSITQYTDIEIGDPVNLCASKAWHSKRRFYRVCEAE